MQTKITTNMDTFQEVMLTSFMKIFPFCTAYFEHVNVSWESYSGRYSKQVLTALLLKRYSEKFQNKNNYDGDNFIDKIILSLVFSCEFRKIFQISFYVDQLRATASVY